VSLDRRIVVRLALAAGLAVAVVVALLIVRSGQGDTPSHARTSPAASAARVPKLASRADLRPPPLTIRRSSRASSARAPGLIFITPKRVFGARLAPGQQTGAEIVDTRGRVRYFKPNRGRNVANELRVQTYRGKPVLTYWYGHEANGTGEGHGVILDRHYRRIATVRAAQGLEQDFHEFLITPQDTALVLAYHKTRAPGGEKVVEGVVQELDIETGKVLTQWRSLPDVKVSESYQPRGLRKGRFDYFHINGAEIDTDGNILVSARHTWAIYKIERHTGKLLWKLGGKDSDFELGRGVQTAWHHDVRSLGPNLISVFDNAVGDTGTRHIRDASRVVRIRLDPERMTAKLVGTRKHPDGVAAGTQANGQWLPNGNLFVGWGSQGVVSEFGKRGALLFDARVPRGNDTYRAYKFEWTGVPTDPPSVAARVRGSRVVVSASWNGSTQVDAWRALTGTRKDRLRAAGRTSWRNLETSLSVRRSRARYVAVQALDARGRVLATSRARRIER
jgi:hypothetical protein